jgi:hypothetical protein
MKHINIHLKEISIMTMILLIFIQSGCKKDCHITGLYEDYECKEGFEEILNFYQVDNWQEFHNYPEGPTQCHVDFTTLGDKKPGCGIIINDTSTLVEFRSGFLNPSIYDTLDLVDLNLNTIISFYAITDLGSRVHDKTFFCINHDTKDFILRYQYELEDQCEGSGIESKTLIPVYVVPKIPDKYDITFSVENVNPYNPPDQ